MTERSHDRDEARRSETGPLEAVFGAAFGPFGATARSVFDANRVAFSVAFGPGVSRPDDGTADGLDGATTVEIEDTGDDGENEAKNASGGTDLESGSESGSDASEASE